MKKLDMTDYVPTRVNGPKIGSDDPNEQEKQCETCKGVVPVAGRIYCVSGIKWCSCLTDVKIGDKTFTKEFLESISKQEDVVETTTSTDINLDK